MKKRIISGVVSFLSLLPLSVTAVGTEQILSSNMSLEDLAEFANKNTYSYKIYEYEKENSEIDVENLEYELKYYKKILNDTSRYDNEYYEYSLKVSELENQLVLAKMEVEYYEEEKATSDKWLLDFSLKSKCYELYLLNKQYDVQMANTIYLDKYAEIELVKFENGQSTDIDDGLAQTNLKIAENKLSAINVDIQFKEREITDLVNQYEYSELFSVNCELPTAIDRYNLTEEELWCAFSKNNFELNKQHKEIELSENYLEKIKKLYGNDNDIYNSYSNSLEINKLNLEITEQKYKSEIARLVSDYKINFEEYKIYTEYFELLSDRSIVLNSSYELGNISELEYLRQSSEIISEMYKVDTIIAEVDLIYDRLELIEKGIWQ